VLPVAEVCANGLDEDCNGVPDNGCPGCTPGTTTMCYTGAAGTSGVGICHGGTQTCASNDMYGACVGQQTPIAEICANGADDDCDGVVDNGCGVCTPGSTGACYDGAAGTSGVGICHGGTHTCQSSDTWGACSGEQLPVAEICANGLDDDCNGVVDNGCGVCTPGATGACYDGAAGTSGVGPCHGGTHTCQSTDNWGACVGEVIPIAEICGNGIDDDCNGVIDNGCGPPNDHCASAIALSMAGTSTTVTGSTVGATHDVTTSCGATAPSPDVFYSFTLGAPTIVYADTEGSGWDSVLSILSSCTTEATTSAGLICDDDSCGTLQSQVYATLPAGTYYILVTGFNGNSGAFTLHFQHELAGGHGNFLLPVGATTQTGNTTGGLNYVTATCGSATGPEDAWIFVRCPNTSGAFSANLCTGTTWDTQLYLRPALGAETCNDDSCALQSSITGTYATPAGTGQLHVLYVDGFGGNAGAYTLTSNMP
jgi:hypothetical protein